MPAHERSPAPATVKPLLQRWLAAVLRPFTKVEPGEAVTVVLMTLGAFLLLSAYYLLKTVREPLILLQGGAETKLYARAGQTLLMLGVVQAYGALARRVGRMKLLAYVFLFFVSNLVVFTVLAKADVPIGLPFFLWVGVFSYTIVAQFWALGADIYTEEQGKRLFPIIGGGSSVGAVAGARFAKTLVPYGAHALMGVAVALLLVCIALIVWVERRAIASRVAVHEPSPDAPVAGEGAFALLARDRYLLLIGGMSIFLNWVNSTGEYLLDRTLLQSAAEAGKTGAAAHAFVGAFKADYYAWYNGIGVALELFAVSRVLVLLGVRRALLFMPLFSLGAYGFAALFPVIGVLRIVKIGENSLQYSLQDTTRNALYLMMSRAEKFVGKTAIDTVPVRLGAIMSALVVFSSSRLGLGTWQLAALNVGLAVCWLGFVLAIGREHLRRSEETPAELAAEPFEPQPAALPVLAVETAETKTTEVGT